jgi:hypothetical protein
MLVVNTSSYDEFSLQQEFFSLQQLGAFPSLQQHGPFGDIDTALGGTEFLSNQEWLTVLLNRARAFRDVLSELAELPDICWLIYDDSTEFLGEALRRGGWPGRLITIPRDRAIVEEFLMGGPETRESLILVFASSPLQSSCSLDSRDTKRTDHHAVERLHTLEYGTAHWRSCVAGSICALCRKQEQNARCDGVCKPFSIQLVDAVNHVLESLQRGTRSLVVSLDDTLEFPVNILDFSADWNKCRSMASELLSFVIECQERAVSKQVRMPIEFTTTNHATRTGLLVDKRAHTSASFRTVIASGFCSWDPKPFLGEWRVCLSESKAYS